MHSMEAQFRIVTNRACGTRSDKVKGSRFIATVQPLVHKEDATRSRKQSKAHCGPCGASLLQRTTIVGHGAWEEAAINSAGVMTENPVDRLAAPSSNRSNHVT